MGPAIRQELILLTAAKKSASSVDDHQFRNMRESAPCHHVDANADFGIRQAPCATQTTLRCQAVTIVRTIGILTVDCVLDSGRHYLACAII
jgi:hypothetical protein